MATKAQGRRSKKLAGKYKDRFIITERNKARREKARKKRFAKLADKRAAKEEKIKREVNGHLMAGNDQDNAVKLTALTFDVSKARVRRIAGIVKE